MPAKEPRKLFALFVGINGYHRSPLQGCINDVLAVRDYFLRLCKAQPAEGKAGIQPVFRYLLAPYDEEEHQRLHTVGLTPGDEDRLFQEEDKYYPPNRNHFIQAFEHHLSLADPARGDLCLLYYSGHGSLMEAPAIFSEVEPTRAFQTLTLLDSREPGKRDLIDKELGYLIAKIMEGKEPDPEQDQPGVHLLALMDCCHSGSNTRAEEEDVAVRQLKSGPAVEAAKEILGFTTEGNCFYKKIVEINGQPKIPRGGLKHGRHINLAAARDAETAKETGLAVETIEVNGQKIVRKKRHGVFTYSLLRALEEGGPHVSYSELIRRVQMDVRALAERQIPVLGKTIKAEADLLFFDNQFKSPTREYEVGYRDGHWYLNAGAIHGIIPPRAGQPTTVRLRAVNRKTEAPAVPEREVAVQKVMAAESVLDPALLTEEDRARLLIASIQEMPFPRTALGFAEKLPETLREVVRSQLDPSKFPYISLTKETALPDYLIRSTEEQEGETFLVLTRPNQSTRLFAPRKRVDLFLRDANKVGKWDSILKMPNPDTEATTHHLRHIRVDIRTLEGVPFTARNFNDIPDSDYQTLPPNPTRVELSYQKDENGKDLQPALRMTVTNTSSREADQCWAGILYLNSKFGISHRYAEVQKLSVDENNPSLELEFQDPAGRTYHGVPVAMDKAYHQLGIDEVTDYLVVFISNQHFDLSPFKQKELPLFEDRAKREGFEQDGAEAETDFWFTIKIPVRVRYPAEEG